MQVCEANDLLIFARVAALGSFSRAAERMGLPKSTVSRRIALLEDQLGERVLLRTTRRLTLTEFGQQLLEHAQQLASEVDAVGLLAAYRQAQPCGRLRVSMPNDFANVLLGDMLAAFIHMHPAIQLEIDVSPHRVDLLAENFDLAIRIGALPDDASLRARRIGVFPVSLYAAPSYLAEHGEPQTPEDLERHETLHLVKADGTLAAWTLWNDHRSWQGRATGRSSANSPELLLQLACAAVGVAAVPDFLAASHVRAARLRRVLPAWHLPVHPVWLVFPERRLMPSKTRAFIELLDQALVDLNRGDSVESW